MTHIVQLVLEVAEGHDRVIVIVCWEKELQVVGVHLLGRDRHVDVEGGRLAPHHLRMRCRDLEGGKCCLATEDQYGRCRQPLGYMMLGEILTMYMHIDYR